MKAINKLYLSCFLSVLIAVLFISACANGGNGNAGLVGTLGSGAATERYWQAVSSGERTVIPWDQNDYATMDAMHTTAMAITVVAVTVTYTDPAFQGFIFTPHP